MITLRIEVNELDKIRVLALAKLMEQFPGSEEIYLELPAPDDCDGCHDRLVLLKDGVDGSPEFLLAMMGLLDV